MSTTISLFSSQTTPKKKRLHKMQIYIVPCLSEVKIYQAIVSVQQPHQFFGIYHGSHCYKHRFFPSATRGEQHRLLERTKAHKD